MQNLTDTFNAESASAFLIPQPDDYTCAAASFATIARLVGAHETFCVEFFRVALSITPENGSDHRDIVAVAENMLRADSTGDYTGGLALAYIVHRPTQQDHAVVFLASRDGDVIYFDPLDKKVYRENLDALPRATDPADPYKLWTANYTAKNGMGFDQWSVLAEKYPQAPAGGEPLPLYGSTPA